MTNVVNLLRLSRILKIAIHFKISIFKPLTHIVRYIRLLRTEENVREQRKNKEKTKNKRKRNLSVKGLNNGIKTSVKLKNPQTVFTRCFSHGLVVVGGEDSAQGQYLRYYFAYGTKYSQTNL